MKKREPRAPEAEPQFRKPAGLLESQAGSPFAMDEVPLNVTVPSLVDELPTTWEQLQELRGRGCPAASTDLPIIRTIQPSSGEVFDTPPRPPMLLTEGQKMLPEHAGSPYVTPSPRESLFDQLKRRGKPQSGKKSVFDQIRDSKRPFLMGINSVKTRCMEHRVSRTTNHPKWSIVSLATPNHLGTSSKPTRRWQRFCSDSCRFASWSQEILATDRDGAPAAIEANRGRVIEYSAPGPDMNSCQLTLYRCQLWNE